jgi:periplasmic protein TonB
MTGLTDSPHTTARARPHHAVAGWLLASAALHALALMALPRFGDNGAQPSVRVLDVVVLMRDPQPEFKSESKPAPAPVAVAPAASRASPRGQAATVVAARQPPRAEASIAQENMAQQNESTIASPATARPDAAPSASAKTAGAVLPTRSQAEAAAPVEAFTPPLFNAAYLRNPPPRYPLAARRNGEQGTVTLRVLVDREGLPASVAIEKTSGYAPLDNAAREAVRAWRFAPARRGNQAVEAWVLVPVVFRLDDMS